MRQKPESCQLNPVALNFYRSSAHHKYIQDLRDGKVFTAFAAKCFRRFLR